MNTINYIEAGDSALFCRMSDSIDPGISERIVQLHKLIQNNKVNGIIESVPSYTGLTIYFNPITIGFNKLKDLIENLNGDLISGDKRPSARLIKIPVCYSKEFASDIEFIAAEKGLGTEDIIELHTGAEYLVYMLGFTPGFPYMGGLNPRLETPRKTEPDLKIKAGSVGIAGIQTGIYPLESPGGWQIIGRTPLALVNFKAKEPFLLKAGDHVVFKAVGLEEYFKIGEAVRDKSYKPEIIDYEGHQDN